MRFLVTFALGEEFAPWRRRGGFQPNGDGRVYRRRRGDIEVSALLTAVGPENAARAVGRALEEETFDVVISSGLAGGLQQRHRPGALLVGCRVRRLDDGQELAPAPEWLDRARKLGAQEAVFVTSSHVAVTQREKRDLGNAADAIEMESFAVMEQAAARGVPGVVIRAVSDPVETELPIDFNRVFDARGRVRAAPLAGALLRRPSAVAGLVRLARESRRASTALAEFLERYVSAEAAEPRGEKAGNGSGS